MSVRNVIDEINTGANFRNQSAATGTQLKEQTQKTIDVAFSHPIIRQIEKRSVSRCLNERMIKKTLKSDSIDDFLAFFGNMVGGASGANGLAGNEARRARVELWVRKSTTQRLP
jgi:hypothetical protein